MENLRPVKSYDKIQVGVRLHPEIHKTVAQIASREHRSVAKVLEIALLKHLKQRKLLVPSDDK